MLLNKFFLLYMFCSELCTFRVESYSGKQEIQLSNFKKCMNRDDESVYECRRVTRLQVLLELSR